MKRAKSSLPVAALYRFKRQNWPWLRSAKIRTSLGPPESGTTASARRGAAVGADFSVIEGAYLRDILDQPRALDETLAGLKVSETLHQLAARLQAGKFKTVVL